MKIHLYLNWIAMTCLMFMDVFFATIKYLIPNWIKGPSINYVVKNRDFLTVCLSLLTTLLSENRQKSWFFDGLSVSFDDVVYEWSLSVHKNASVIETLFFACESNFCNVSQKIHWVFFILFFCYYLTNYLHCCWYRDIKRKVLESLKTWYVMYLLFMK